MDDGRRPSHGYPDSIENPRSGDALSGDSPEDAVREGAVAIIRVGQAGAMKPTDPRARSLRAGNAQRVRQPARRRRTTPLFQVHPVPQSRAHVLAIAAHFIRQYEDSLGKQVPGLSEDGAVFLTSRRWSLTDLANRLYHAVRTNQGSLITAADLSDQ